MNPYESRFWMKSWDEGLRDFSPEELEKSYLDLALPTLERCADRDAMIFMGAGISYRDLDRMSNRFARMLAAEGLVKGDAVGVNLPNTPEYVIAWLGALKAGCAVTGVSPLLSPEEMEHQLKDAEVKALVTLDAIFEHRLVGLAPRLPELKVVVACSIAGFMPKLKGFIGKLLGKIPKGKVGDLPGKRVMKMEEVVKKERYSDARPDVSVSPDDACYIQYTGGTTGPPKGAVLTHKNAATATLLIARWLHLEQGANVGLSAFPFFHIAGLAVNQVVVSLGWTQILVPDPRNTGYICGAMKKFRPSLLANVPSLYQMLIADPKFGKLDHSILKICLSGASPFPESSQREMEAIVGEGKLLEVFGMTETSPLTAMNPARGKKRLGSVGLPIMNVDMKLVDPETKAPVPLGEPGEICVRGPMVMAGYFKKPDETEKCMDAEGYLNTGDVGVMDATGYIKIVDRSKDMIIVGGYKVFSRKVEEVLGGHPEVENIALIGVPNPERPGSEIVKACVQLKTGRGAAADQEAVKADILRTARERLAPYEAPKFIEFMGEIPLTSVGKVDKKKLRSMGG